ncbi:Rrf2 family transcriptional regulator [Trichocoleus sp. DQ-A3]|uniref:Rrf2 family transcriptional regulator n=1 Tax=Cyanophyceae TaxID=3028117 RepID=UPI0030DCB59F
MRYAFLALLELASHHKPRDFLQIDHIAAGQQIPDRYLAQVLMTLWRCGLVLSQRGAFIRLFVGGGTPANYGVTGAGLFRGDRETGTLESNCFANP